MSPLSCARRSSAGEKGFIGKAKQDETTDTSAGTTHSVTRNPMRSGEQDIIWQLIPRSRHTNSEETPLLSRKTAHFPRHKRDCHESYGACSWATRKVIIAEAIPEAVTSFFPCYWLEELTRTTDKERYEILGRPFQGSARKTSEDQSHTGTSGGAYSRTSSRNRSWLYHIGYKKFE